MARPSFRRRRLAGESGGGRDGDLCAWRRPRQERLQRGWTGCVRRSCDASQGRAGDADGSGREASSVRDRDGGLLRGSSSGLRLRHSWPRCPADVAEYVRPYVKAQKNDERDAEGIAEAATRPTMRFVELSPPLARQRASSGRDLAAWLGLVPRQFTTGGKPKLLGISKRGNKYLRRQLIHGARAALPYVVERDTSLGRWAKGLFEPRPPQRCDRRLRQQAGEDRLGGVEARRTVRRHKNAGGGIELSRSRSKRPSVNRCLREGDNGMA
jgi:hypothetical protein